jgi:diketogulonate reductase-like aldo/keto reductase
MKHDRGHLERRTFLRRLGALAAGLGLAIRGTTGLTASPMALTKKIPGTGEALPVIGMGTWGTFDTSGNEPATARLLPVLQAFFDQGGALIDSSPMYGSSEYIVGQLLKQTRNRERLFAATKVWTLGQWLGVRQMERSREFWGVKRFDLMQIHNMLDWEAHLETLKEWKGSGRIRYIGITTSHGRRHEEMEKALAREPFDFVQLTYNILDREAEQRLLPLARERSIAVIANRPFQRAGLFSHVKGKALPDWAPEFDCHNWAQFFLKFIVSHPSITCAIPATSRLEHMLENMGAGFGRLPDEALRKRMIAHFSSL